MNIFARPSYIGNRFPKHIKDSTLLRVSSRVRGEEMAEYLGCQLNVSGDGVNVFVKPAGLNYVKDGDWVDILDGKNLIPYLKKRPKVKVIAASKTSFNVLKQELKNEIVLIPQQHINWERKKHIASEIKNVGYIGSVSPYALKHYGEISEKIIKNGLNFKLCFNFKTKEDSLNFYENIDIMIIGAWDLGDPGPFKIPTKIINAASFGVPTVAYPIQCYEEIDEYYLKANNMEELLTQVEKLRDKTFYNEVSARIIGKAEEYHISHIANMYRELT
jgi:hypothetical protein